ncbi:MAG: metallophosphoesterase [Ignavibacteriaceae bacterium]
MRNITGIFIAAVLLYLVEYYFTKKVSKAIKNVFPKLPDKKRKAALTIFLVWINLYPLFLIFDWSYAAISKTYTWVPQNSFFDYFLIYPFWAGLFIVVQSDLFFLIIDVFGILLFPIWKKYQQKILSYETKAIVIITILFLFYVPLRMVHDEYAVSIRIVEYKKKDLPEALNNFKITFISDIQADRYTDRARLTNYIKKVNSTHPDLVLIGGDVITSTPEYINEAAEYISKIKSRYGIYSCVGDHDNWAYHNNYSRSLKEVETALNKQGIQMVDNGKRYINVDSIGIEITFVTNTYVERIPVDQLDSLAELKHKYALKIFLAHQPRVFLANAATKYNYDLYLAGHTHGGQITFLFPFKNLSPTLIETPYVRGDFHFTKQDGEKMLLVVTRGLGMSIAPVRYNSTPEITVIIIEKG